MFPPFIKLAGVVGFEPTHVGVRVRCLTAWRYPNINYIYICIIAKKILIINPNLINIKNTLNKIEKNKINKFKVIINNYNNYSIDEKVIKNIFKGNKVIGKINYKKEYDSLINNNFKIPENNLKNIMKDFNYIEI